jgi:hypothetical protein
MQGDYLAGIDLPSSDEEEEEYEKSARVDEDREVQLVQVGKGSVSQMWGVQLKQRGLGQLTCSALRTSGRWSCTWQNMMNDDAANPSCQSSWSAAQKHLCLEPACFQASSRDNKKIADKERKLMEKAFQAKVCGCHALG